MAQVTILTFDFEEPAGNAYERAETELRRFDFHRPAEYPSHTYVRVGLIHGSRVELQEKLQATLNAECGNISGLVMLTGDSDGLWLVEKTDEQMEKEAVPTTSEGRDRFIT